MVHKSNHKIQSKFGHSYSMDQVDDPLLDILFRAHRDAVEIWVNHEDRQVGRTIRDKAFTELVKIHNLLDDQQNQ